MNVIYFSFFLVAILYESITKGWLSLIMVPALIVVVPVAIVVYIMTRRQLSKQPHALLRGAIWTLFGVVLAAYLLAVGFGDTEDVLLFGFLQSTVDNPIAQTSNILYLVASLATVPALIFWIVAIVIAKRQSRSLGR